MRQSGKCPKCGSDDIVPHVMVADRNHTNGEQDLQLRVDARPDALFFTHAARSPLAAYVCAACGYTELYATRPLELREAHRESQGLAAL